MTKPSYTVRMAQECDIPGIFELLSFYAAQGIVLPRTQEDIAAYLGNFTVAVTADDQVIGCAAARDFGNGLFEVRSLAVPEEFQSMGVGRKLVEYLIRSVRDDRGGSRLFALTCKVGFFERLGFKPCGRDEFPEKIWSDCVNCRKKDCCDELAVLMNL